MVSACHSHCLPHCVSPAFSASSFTESMTPEAVFCPYCKMHRVFDSTTSGRVKPAGIW